MELKSQIKEIVNYIRSGEKNIEDFTVGVEFEHFVIDKDTLETVSYYGQNGVGEALKALEKNGWEGIYEGEYLLALTKDDNTITLEPGSQFELSIKSRKNIEDLEGEYFKFLQDVIPILEERNQQLIAVGYHPETKIEDIKLLPKKRYDLMFNYFKTKGSHAHNMMKGTAALQVTIDYKSEEDYVKKFRIANALSPVFFGLFDSGYYFQGDRWPKYNIRSLIWNNCDEDRSGIVEGALEDGFNYEKYAEYILNRPPIFTIRDNEVIPTYDKKVKDILDPNNYKKEELEHLLTMFFPDVRTKKFIEIRMMDSIPYPLNFSVVALIKGIFYNKANLGKVYDFIKDITINDVNKSKYSIIEDGLQGRLKDKTIFEVGRWLVDLAKDGLSKEEAKYIIPLEKMLERRENPYEIIRKKSSLGKKESLEWCILNNIIEVKR